MPKNQIPCIFLVFHDYGKQFLDMMCRSTGRIFFCSEYKDSGGNG